MSFAEIPINLIYTFAVLLPLGLTPEVGHDR